MHPALSGTAPLRLILVLLAMVSLAGCTLVGTPPAEPPAPTVAEGASIGDGMAGAEADAATARLLDEAERLLADGDGEGALARTREIQTRYPSAQGSARSLLLEARAHGQLGDFGDGLRAAEEFLRLAEPERDPVDEARLVIAELRIDGDLGGGVEALFELPDVLDENVRERGLERARALSREMDDPLLRQLLAEAPRHPWLLPVFQAELAERRMLIGDRDSALELVASARALDPATRELERLRAVEEDEVDAREGLIGTLGAVLSLEGSPSLRGLSEQIRDGIEVALLEDGVRGAVQLAREEDGGVGAASTRALESLHASRPFGVVGPVSPVGFREAARSGGTNVPMISPTSDLPPNAREGIYSLTGVDPEAARALARLAVAQGYRSVSVLHARSPGEEAEMRWFSEALSAEGGRVVQTLSYPEGANDFRNQIAQVERERPQALVVLAAPGDLPVLAAQLAFLGEDLDDEIPILGNSAWASDQTLSNLPTSQTNGILSVAPHAGEGYGPRWDRFVSGYEGHFRRTLRDPVPALGYDAALLLIEGARLGGGSAPDDVIRGMRRIEGFEGATGTFSVRDGRLVRAHFPVRLRNGARVALTN
ncbi:MAG: hypothetical protein EA351_12420 [Gemmatimonadales bacterium]|nr:MAG: hypothetical protein EA351_12420 [Gemmatimonadales bacterium]